MIKIGDLFDIEKGSVQSSKCVEGEYNFITASEKWKTHNEYTHECEALIFAMGASGSLGRTHYVNGKFVTSDLCFILTPKNKYKDKLNLRFYYYYFNTFREKIVSATATGTSKLAINRKILSNHKIHYIDIDRQIALIGKIEAMQEVSKSIIEEIAVQEKYVSSLRQSILQQAVEGKLCEQYPADEPASVLLDKIKAEKEKLIAEKKIKKQKELPPIADEEKPFDLPQGWEWCRLGEVCDITDGTHQTPRYTETGMPFLSAQNVKPFRFMPEIFRTVSKDDYDMYVRSTKAKKGDILMARVGAGIGEAAIVDKHIDFAIYVSLCLIKAYFKELSMQYLLNWINGVYGKEASRKNTLGKGTSQGNLNLNLIRVFIIPLPPLAEQQRIVEKVDKLMALCDELEQEVTSAKKYASQLMEAVLQEAFSNKSEEMRDNVVVLAPQLQQANITKPLLAAAARGKMSEATWKRIADEAVKLASEES